MKDKLTIFYTDDDYDDLEFFKEIVSDINQDFDVVTQSDGFELLDALNNPPPNPYVVFLDINMPGINGLDILKSLRSTTEHQALPIVMLSTSNDETIIEKTRLLGATYYMPKSGIFENLKKSIEHALSINWRSFTPTNDNFVYNN